MSISQYNVDIRGLEDLLKNVVMYVEYRRDNEDISSTLSREVKELGASVVDKRTKDVTHILFNEGTLRTSDWAKKHGIPLVNASWIADCIRFKTCLLSTPYHVSYMEPTYDRLGFKTKTRYKKYNKVMNSEEYEKHCNARIERHRKELEKSLNNSKSTNSFDEDENTRRILKMSEAPIIPPDMPAKIKKIQDKLERFEKGGRFSSDEDELDNSKNNSPNSNSDKEISYSPNTSAVEEFNKRISDNTSPRTSSDSSYNNDLPKPIRKLFNQHETSPIDDLIVPRKSSENVSLQSFLPKSVIELSRSAQKRSRPDDDNNKDDSWEVTKKKQKIQETKNIKTPDIIENLSADIRVKRKSITKSLSITKNKDIYNFTDSDESSGSSYKDNNIKKRKLAKVKKKPIDLLTLAKNLENKTKKVKSKSKKVSIDSNKSNDEIISDVTPHSASLPLSPLITNKPSISTGLITPKSKRYSLRTKLLKKSAKKTLRESLNKSNSSNGISNNYTTPDRQKPKILVPETALKDQKSSILTSESVFKSPGFYFNKDDLTIPETPTQNLPPNSLCTPEKSSLKFTDSMIDIFDTPGATKLLTKEYSDYVYNVNTDPNLFIVKKDTYDHCSHSLPPDYYKIANSIANEFNFIKVNNLSNILSKIEQNVTRENSDEDDDALKIFKPKTKNKRKSKRKSKDIIFDESLNNEIVDVVKLNGKGRKSKMLVPENDVSNLSKNENSKKKVEKESKNDKGRKSLEVDDTEIYNFKKSTSTKGRKNQIFEKDNSAEIEQNKNNNHKKRKSKKSIETNDVNEDESSKKDKNKNDNKINKKITSIYTNDANEDELNDKLVDTTPKSSLKDNEKNKKYIDNAKDNIDNTPKSSEKEQDKIHKKRKSKKSNDNSKIDNVFDDNNTILEIKNINNNNTDLIINKPETTRFKKGKKSKEVEDIISLSPERENDTFTPEFTKRRKNKNTESKKINIEKDGKNFEIDIDKNKSTKKNRKSTPCKDDFEVQPSSTPGRKSRKCFLTALDAIQSDEKKRKSNPTLETNSSFGELEIIAKPTNKQSKNKLNVDKPNVIYLDNDSECEGQNIHNGSSIFNSPTTTIKSGVKRNYQTIIDTDDEEYDQNKLISKKHKKSDGFGVSRDDFVMSPYIPAAQILMKKSKIKSHKEIYVIGVSEKELSEIIKSCSFLSSKYSFTNILRSKEQIVVIPNQIKNSLDFTKALIYGNKFISQDWIDQSIKYKKWLDYEKYAIEEKVFMKLGVVKEGSISNLLKDYCPMYISSTVRKIQKYKLRILIEKYGGQVTDSFRNAGIVIGARKSNAVSTTEDWILDAISNGKVDNPEKYQYL